MQLDTAMLMTNLKLQDKNLKIKFLLDKSWNAKEMNLLNFLIKRIKPKCSEIS